MPILHKILFLIGKGGSGKSTTAAAVAEYLRNRKIVHQLLSLELHGSLLKRLYPGAQAIKFSEIEIGAAGTELDAMYGAVLKSHTIVDCGANTARGLLTWFNSTSFLELSKSESFEIALVFFGIPGSSDCVDLLDKLHLFAGSAVHWFVVKSPVYQGDFTTLEAKAAFIGATVVGIHVIPDRILELCVNNCIPITTTELPSTLNILDRQRIRTQSRDYTTSIEPITKFLT